MTNRQLNSHTTKSRQSLCTRKRLTPWFACPTSLFYLSGSKDGWSQTPQLFRTARPFYYRWGSWSIYRTCKVICFQGTIIAGACCSVGVLLCHDNLCQVDTWLLKLTINSKCHVTENKVCDNYNWVLSMSVIKLFYMPLVYNYHDS